MDQLISPELAQLIGVGGAISYLLSYALLQAGLLHGNSYTYAAMNGAGALMVMVSLIHAFNLASLLIQVSFLAVSVLGIARIAYLTSRARFSTEERLFLDTKLPDLPVHAARRLLDAGTWTDIRRGESLAVEGQRQNWLMYVAEGEVSVQVKGVNVGTRPPQTYIGELSSLDGAPATATVEAVEDCRCFVIAADRIRNLVDTNADIRLSLLASFSANTKDTLLRRSDEIAASKTPRPTIADQDP
jgi:CRP-like cAMP-binding protein